MRVSKLSMVLSLLITVITFSAAFLINEQAAGSFPVNALLGVFASAMLVLATSTISYCCEERKSLHEYYWQLVRLKHKALILSTLPRNTGYETYYAAISSMNEIISGYFAICEQDYIFPQREKIQKFLEIQTALGEFKELSLGAEVYYRKYLCEKVLNDGSKAYSRERFASDARPFCNAIDSFMDTGASFVVYLDKKIREFSCLLRPKKMESELDGQA